jgi:ArsR family transcriptional regulator
MTKYLSSCVQLWRIAVGGFPRIVGRDHLGRRRKRNPRATRPGRRPPPVARLMGPNPVITAFIRASARLSENAFCRELLHNHIKICLCPSTEGRHGPSHCHTAPACNPTRLRLLLLLRQAELTVGELIEIVGQSQPRVSRHLKRSCRRLLGASRKALGFLSLSEAGSAPRFAAAVASITERRSGRPGSDLCRLAAVREARREAAAYSRPTQRNGSASRRAHARRMEAAIVRHIAGCRWTLCSMPAGNGHAQLLSPHVKRAVGVDVVRRSRDRAADWRARRRMHRCASPALLATRCQRRATRLRCGALSSGSALSTILLPPWRRARVMRPGGRVLIADFAPRACGSRRCAPSPARLLRPRSARLVPPPV